MQGSHQLLALTLAGVLAAAGLMAGCGSSSSSGSPSTSTKAAASTPRLDAPAQASPPRPAPEFSLRDSNGKSVSLASYRGKTVLLTFIYAHCPDVCPLIVGNLHAALAQMGPAAAAKTQIIAVSVDPKGDTAAAVDRFVAAHDMTGRMEYLIGSRAQLVPVWKKYGVQAQGTPDSREVDHSAFVYGITGSGSQLALYPSNFKPEWIAHDTPLLASR
jgi:protein SCO1/2